MGFVIGLFLGLGLGVFLQPAVAMLIAQRAHAAASRAADTDDDYRRIVIQPVSPSLPSPPPNVAPPFQEARSTDRGR